MDHRRGVNDDILPPELSNESPGPISSPKLNERKIMGANPYECQLCGGYFGYIKRFSLEVDCSSIEDIEMCDNCHGVIMDVLNATLSGLRKGTSWK